MVIVVIVFLGALRVVHKGHTPEELEIGGWAKTIETTTLQKPARILRWVLLTWRDLLSLGPQWKTISLHGHENSRDLI